MSAKIRLFCWAIVFLCCIAPCALSETGTVTASALVLREGPALDAAMLGEIPQGTQLELGTFEEGWYRVIYNGQTGYVSARYVRVNLPEGASAPIEPQAQLPTAPPLTATAPPGSQLPTLVFDEENNPGYPMVMKPGDMGNSVIDLQKTLAEFGYAVAADGQFGYDTHAAVMRLQLVMGIDADGLVGMQTRRLIGKTQSGVELLDWWKGGNVAFARLTEASLVDVRTGRRFRISRYGGDNHCDVEPLSTEDARTMKEIIGGEWNWERRPVWLEVNGRVIAASINCMPHQGQHNWSNDFDGHFCLHFYNSRTHDTDRIDEAHAACVQEAWAAKDRYTP